MADDWDPFADPAGDDEAPKEPTRVPEAKPEETARATLDEKLLELYAEGHHSLDDQLLQLYIGGHLGSAIEEYRQLMRSISAAPESVTLDSRLDGVPSGYGAEYAPAVHHDGRPRLVLYGDSLTHAFNPEQWAWTSAPFCTAIARRNGDGLSVENAGWGGLMALMIDAPQNFPTSFGPLPLPRPQDLPCEYLCICVGTNDAMSMCAPEVWTDMFKVGGPQGGVPKLPEDWRDSCCPSTEAFERSLLSAVRDAKAATGARIAIATPPAFGEDLTDACADKRMRKSPYAAISELAAAVRRVARAQDCDVLPLFECTARRLGELQRAGRGAIPWSPANFGRLMAASMGDPSIGKAPLEELGPEPRPALCHDLVHFNEAGGAIYAALVQTWLDARMAE